MASAPGSVDVLIVGAGPTGLTLAVDLALRGVSFRIVDHAADAVHESRALAIQARTLEVLDHLGVSDALIAAGDSATTLLLHFKKSTAPIELFNEGLDETSYPFLLFLSQAQTETILLDRLTGLGVEVERGVELTGLDIDADEVTGTVTTPDGSAQICARYVIGCDGSHSAVRHAAGIGFSGTGFPQKFVIADLEADALEADRVHVYMAEEGMMFFFPLGSPATWRMLAMVPEGNTEGEPTLEFTQSLVARYTGDPVVLHDPVWLTNFSVQSRRADHFRVGRVLLAGDAAHIHSPAGAQGMNTGIQDAVNLGWKLALVCRGLASDELLSSYERERLPIADSVLHMTNRLFRVATSSSPFLRFFRPRAAATVVPIALRMSTLRTLGFRVISQLGIHYRRSPLSVEGSPRLRRGPHAGDRMPDAGIVVDDVANTLHRCLSPTAFQLVLCGPLAQWQTPDFREAWTDELIVARLTADVAAGVWSDPESKALPRLGLREGEVGHYLVRPDGYIAYRARGTNLDGVRAYLEAIFEGEAAPVH